MKPLPYPIQFDDSARFVPFDVNYEWREDSLVITGRIKKRRSCTDDCKHRRLRMVLLLFATGPGSEIQRPLAVVVIGGLQTSTLLTLILLPILYRRYGVK